MSDPMLTGGRDACRKCGRKLVDQSDLWAGLCNNDDACRARADAIAAARARDGSDAGAERAPVSHKDWRVVLSARVDPTVLDYAREAAREAGLAWSLWVERAVVQALGRESGERAFALARALERALDEGDGR